MYRFIDEIKGCKVVSSDGDQFIYDTDDLTIIKGNTKTVFRAATQEDLKKVFERGDTYKGKPIVFIDDSNVQSKVSTKGRRKKATETDRDTQPDSGTDQG